WLGGKYRPALPTDHGPDIMALCRRFMTQEWQGEAVFQVQITALDPHPGNSQLEMFAPDRRRTDDLNQARDAINQRYGEFALAPARLLLRSSMPNVIAPAWKPSGHRETIL
ncbi:MAG: DNA polymerase IV, partial [Gammaproteobacteria bacterium]